MEVARPQLTSPAIMGQTTAQVSCQFAAPACPQVEIAFYQNLCRICHVAGDLFGKYRLGDRIARGGMAEIYHGHTLGAAGFAREIVVKRILPDLVEDPEFLAMFREEADLASMLDHPNIVQIFDFEQEGDSFYIVMEYVKGGDLSKLIRYAAEQRQRLPAEVVVFVVSEILEGLRYAHELKDEDGRPLNLVHRDISPANILLSFAGAVKLADFGIAKAATSMVHTSAGILKGKYPYMAPEQAAGKHVDRRTDLFSMGIVLYQALLGRRPFRGRDSAELLDAVINGDYQSPKSILPSMDQRLVNIISKALQVKPEDRYQNASEFLTDLRVSLDKPPSRETLEECLRKYVPEQQRTVSGVRQGVEFSPTLRAPATSSDSPLAKRSSSTSSLSLNGPSNVGSLGVGSIDSVEDPSLEMPTQRSINPVAKKKRNVTIVGGVLGAVVVAALLLAGLFFAGLLPGSGENTEPVSTAEPEVRTFTVLARKSREQLRELQEHGLDQALEQRSMKLRMEQFTQYHELFKVLDTMQVDLASVPLAVAKSLAQQKLIIPVENVAGARIETIRSPFCRTAREVSTPRTAVGSILTYVPEYLEVHVLAYRVSKVAFARERWGEMRDEIEEALRQVNGRGLPEGYALEESPEEWDEFDIFVLGWVWSRSDSDSVVPAPRLALRSASYWPSVEGLLERVSLFHGDPQTTWVRNDAMVDVLTWLALHREHDLMAQTVWHGDPQNRANGTTIADGLSQGLIYMARVNQFRASTIRDAIGDQSAGFSTDDLAFASLPAGVSVMLDESGAPIRRGGHDGIVNAWLWAIPRTATDPQASLEIALELAGTDMQAHFAEQNCWIPSNTGVEVTTDRDGVSEYCRRAMTPGRDRLHRPPLRFAVYPSDGAHLNSTVNQFERLWNELLVGHGYRPEEGSGIDMERLRAIVERYIPEP